jgi:hypothetical protein
VTARGEQAPPAIDWNALMRQPVAYIDLIRLAGCFDNTLGLELCGRLRDASRLQERLSALIGAHYALAAPPAEEAVSDVDRGIALLPAEQIADLTRRAGAIYWANAIANVVLAEDVRRLHEQIGEAICAFALANRHLAGPVDAFESLDDVGACLTQDGERCFAAWCQSLPEAIGVRVRLKLPMRPTLDDGPPSAFADIGPSIVRNAAI